MIARLNRFWPAGSLFLLLALVPAVAPGASSDGSTGKHSPARVHNEALANPGIDWPSFGEVVDVALLRTYNTRLVVLNTTILGIATGLVGSFLLLRKRSLMGDVLSHACLPGIGLLFVVMVALGGSGKALPGLLLGAALTGIAGLAVVLLIRNTTKIKDDAAMGIVLSVFFGFGVVILGMVQSLPGASAAGLESFIYGKAASMVFQDFLLIGVVAAIILIITLLMFKELNLLCFDETYAGALGWPVTVIDLVMLGLVAGVTVIGLQAVGLILIIAFLITPAAAARFWTEDLSRMLPLAALIGGVSGWFGASVSALLPRLPAGAVIVLVVALLFIVSMFFGTARGVVPRYAAHRRLQRKVGRQNMLRTVWELLETERGEAESGPPLNSAVGFGELLAMRSWSPALLRRHLVLARRDGLVARGPESTVQLTAAGFDEAARTTRNHRLWEMYLITHADIAPQHVDRDADTVEHVLGPEMVAELERCLDQRLRSPAPPPSPHLIKRGGATP
jgi:manganese/zinc/iron transport system permease protein